MTPIYDSGAPRVHRHFKSFVIDVIDKNPMEVKQKIKKWYYFPLEMLITLFFRVSFILRAVLSITSMTKTLKRPCIKGLGLS